MAELDAELGFAGFGAGVPDFDGAVAAGGGEDVGFGWGPLEVFDAACVADEGFIVGDESTVVVAVREEYLAVVVPC